MSIFNSLGSNYDLGFAIRTLFSSSRKESLQLKKLLEEKYGGKAILTYKGREALRLALRAINKPKEYTVGICGFTCFAVYEAIAKEGYKVEYLDIEKDSLNFSFETLKSALKKNPRIKIILIQNTLGYPCNMENISKFCKENSIILVEDLAHSIGAKYNGGREAGTVGDFTMLSFSQDKVIDRVSGGALIVRNSQFTIHSLQLNDISLDQQGKDRFYPISTYLIRKIYRLKIGKIIHYLLKKINFLSNPMSYQGMDDIHSLPTGYASAISIQFNSLEKDISHRQKIAEVYSRLINKKVLSQAICNSISPSSNLRLPIFVANRIKLIDYLNNSGIYVSDIWYDVPIAPKKYLDRTSYKKGECPNAENISKKILNLPTHRNVSESDAKLIANKINLWLESQ